MLYTLWFWAHTWHSGKQNLYTIKYINLKTFKKYFYFPTVYFLLEKICTWICEVKVYAENVTIKILSILFAFILQVLQVCLVLDLVVHYWAVPKQKEGRHSLHTTLMMYSGNYHSSYSGKSLQLPQEDSLHIEYLRFLLTRFIWEKSISIYLCSSLPV